MEEELERKIFYKKDYNDVKELQKEAEAYAQSLRSKYTDTIVTQEYIHGDDILVRATTIKYRYRNEQIRDREKERIRQREMTRQFDTEFKRINEEFGKVFREMFGGGNGTIELEEDADILDAGITIIAQPPGKKLQNMMQLSGGEKALTAIAVLFAIQNLKPSPFCMLDEIEAALDDANIDRFANYLKKLSGGIQFIVITHRKGTMEAAHRLYGITMQEKGVSSLISVNLEDVDDEIA